jgi:hypothetical protein
VRQRLFALALLIGVTGCALRGPRGCRAARDPAEFPRLATAHARDAGVHERSGLTEQRAADGRRGQRFARAHQLARCGTPSTSSEYLVIAQLAAAVPPTDSTLRAAYAWARTAVERDTANVAAWQSMATAWDRWQVALRRPQWFGTQVTCPVGLGRCRLAPVDTARVADAQRLQIGLRTLAQMRLAADSLSSAQKRP